MRHSQSLYILLTLLLAGNVSTGFAGDCEHCGCCSDCEKVCRLVCEEKKVEITCWGAKCEDFCIGTHSKQCCKHTECVCEECDEEVDSLPKKFVWKEWIPGCAKIYTKKKLMKRTITKKVPSYKWVVEDLCDKCQANCEHVEIPKGAEIPTPPDVDAKLIY